MSRVLIAHTRSTRREGWKTLLATTLTIGTLFGFFHWFFPQVRNEDPFFYFAFYGIGLTVWVVMLFGYVVPNLRMKRDFHFLLTDETIECQIPHRCFGESFSIKLAELERLESECPDDSRQWYLVTADQRRIKLTPNYGNPVSRIIDTLHELKPDLIIDNR